MGPRNHAFDGVEIPQWERAILGVVWTIEKHWESMLWRFVQQKKSVMATAVLQQPHAILHTG